MFRRGSYDYDPFRQVSSKPAGRIDSVRYAVVIERAGDNYSAYIPDLPGCIATGGSVPEVESEIRDAIRFHIGGLRDDGLPVPKPVSLAEYVEA
jgi:predicted RNase H-like HicB family nuclease